MTALFPPLFTLGAGLAIILLMDRAGVDWGNWGGPFGIVLGCVLLVLGFFITYKLEERR